MSNYFTVVNSYFQLLQQSSIARSDYFVVLALLATYYYLLRGYSCKLHCRSTANYLIGNTTEVALVVANYDNALNKLLVVITGKCVELVFTTGNCTVLLLYLTRTVLLTQFIFGFTNLRNGMPKIG